MMRYPTNFFDFKVLTTHGTKYISELRIDDQLYEYRSGNLLDVLQVKKCFKRDCYIVTFADGRSMPYMENDLIFLGDRCVRFRVVRNKECPIGAIPQYPLSYQKLTTPLFPDPYVTGAFLMYGDFDDPYINLPLQQKNADEFIFHRYDLTFGTTIGPNKVYFKSNKNETEKLITWKEFFPNYKMYVTSKNVNDPIIPMEYQTASINDRWKFVRGVFDLGYDRINFPDMLGIGNKYEFRLQEFQKILWSLGILSKVSYDPYQMDKEMTFRLDILGDRCIYPGFFYHVPSMEYVLEQEEPYAIKFSIAIQSIQYYGKVTFCQLRLDKSRALYVTDNFLPRVSLE